MADWAYSLLVLRSKIKLPKSILIKLCSFQNQNQEKPATTTTVFVGNITERASDALIRQILTVCTEYASFVIFSDHQKCFL